MLVPLLFFCSGATALVYEVVWSKYLTLMFGSTVQAQTVVLAVFMGGLALGNRLFGARADRSPQPLAMYGYIEVCIGLYAFFFNQIYKLADVMFVQLGSPIFGRRFLLLLLKGLLSVALLLGPTILMGGTLPLLAAWLQRKFPDAGRWSARFYSINSLGAVVGSGLAGFFLVRELGMVSTLQLTAMVNVLVGFTAVGLARQQGDFTPTAKEGSTAKDTTVSSARVFRGACALVALTGGVSMGMEVLASRSLVLIFGASLQAFAIVLMAFILGIGLGAAVIASPRLQRLRREIGSCALLMTAAGIIGILVLGITLWVEFYARAKSGLAPSDMGYRYHQLLAAGMSMIVLGVPAGLLGAVLPLWIRTLAAESAALGDRVGRLLTWNTLGAVVGVLTTGFLLMPNLGLRGSFYVLVVVMCLGAFLIAWVNRRPRLAFAAAGLGVLLTIAGVSTGEGWRHVLSSGVFRMRGTYWDPEAMTKRRKYIKILFYEDAADATVSVEQGDGVVAKDDIGLRINGKVDASSRVDLSTQYLCAHLPMAVRPDSKDVFILGVGSGISAGALLGHPLERIVVAENCEPVIRAARFFAPWNRDVLTNPRVQVRNEDARTVLKLSPKLYDVIICEPSNPWTVGVGSIFSREFYELAAGRLKDGGVVCQWFHVYEMSDGIVSMVLRTFASVFPNVEIWDPGSGDILMLGGRRPFKSSAEVYRTIFERPEVRKDMEAIGIKSPEALWARQLASQRTAFAIPGEGPIQSDLFPVLEYEAPKAFFIATSAAALSLFDERTWQKDLMPPDKRAALVSLDVQPLISIFGVYTSVNEQLNGYLALRFHGESNPGTLADDGAMPCVFRPANAKPFPPRISDTASEELRRLIGADVALRANPEDWQGPISVIEGILRAHQAAGAQKVDWSPPNFALLAAKTCVQHGNVDRAKALVALGLQNDPKGVELLYLRRVLDREPPLAQAAGAAGK
jgi:predicted membrane-bound spermidine synthase